MDRTEVNIETICKRVREALAHESAANVEPREERAAFLEAFARRRAGSTFVRSLRQRRLRWLPLALARPHASIASS